MDKWSFFAEISEVLILQYDFPLSSGYLIEWDFLIIPNMPSVSPWQGARDEKTETQGLIQAFLILRGESGNLIQAHYAFFLLFWIVYFVP